jgi:hypothetical protein
MTQEPTSSSNNFTEIYRQAEKLVQSDSREDQLEGAAILKWLHQQGEKLISLGAVDKVAIKAIQEQLRQQITDI